MKKVFITAINLLALVICMDINNIFNLYRLKDGAGIGIYILGGIIKINGRVPFDKVPVYIAALLVIVLTVIVYDIYIVYKIKKRS